MYAILHSKQANKREWRSSFPAVSFVRKNILYTAEQFNGDVQDITTLVLNVGHNFANGMTEQVLLERTQSIQKEDFKFGTDNYLWITKVDLNR